MINEQQYKELSQQHPPLGEAPDKVKELIRDELEPHDEIVAVRAPSIAGADGVTVLTTHKLNAFWLQKMFWVFKFPAIQTFHREQLKQVQVRGSQVFLRTEASAEDYEENSFVFPNSSQASEFATDLGGER